MANLDKITKVPEANAWVLLRIVPDWFAFFSISHIREHMKKDTQEKRAHSGKVWGFYCDLDEGSRRITISAKSEKSASFSTELLDWTGAAAALAEVRI